MRFHTTDLTSEASGSLNGGKSHALFYVFHIVPEFVVVATILSLNVREMFGTGLWEGLLGRKVVTRPSARV